LSKHNDGKGLLIFFFKKMNHRSIQTRKKINKVMKHKKKINKLL
jgi:hypothetical protein